MQIDRVMILWNPARNGREGGIKVVEHPDARGRYYNDRSYERSSGACDMRWRQMSDAERVTSLFRLFHQMTVRDRLDPEVVNRALWEIDEFAEAACDSMFPYDYEEAMRRSRAHRHVSVDH